MLQMRILIAATNRIKALIRQREAFWFEPAIFQKKKKAMWYGAFYFIVARQPQNHLSLV